MLKLVHAKNNLWYGKFDIFPENKVIHAISTRFNGYSKAPFNGLNLALHVQDNNDDVLNNRKLFCEGLNLDYAKMTTCQQIHSNKIVCVTKDKIGKGNNDFSDTIIDTNALITNIKQVPLTLFFADCTPVMIYDPIHEAIGIAHAGWRGTALEIASKTVEMMMDKYNTNPSDCMASVGPTIGRCCYEVGEEVVEKFKAMFKTEKEQAKILDFHEEKQKYHLDLMMINSLILQRVGLKKENIDLANICTACNRDVFFSYRADNGKTGRIAAIISLI